MGRQQIRCHGDARRFDEIARLVHNRFDNIRYVADVGGGQGLLSRILRKRLNLDSEVIDPRGWVLKGVTNRELPFEKVDPTYYDLIIGLHPDEALRPVVEASLSRPTIVVPCCNFWSDTRMGLKEMLASIEKWYFEHRVRFDSVTANFKGPYNKGFVTHPPEVIY